MAFDTVDQDILLLRLETTYGFTGHALEWFRSYLYSRAFSVKFGDSRSTSVLLQCEASQGPVLGPLLFILWTAQLEDVAMAYGHMQTTTNRTFTVSTVVPQPRLHSWKEVFLRLVTGWRRADLSWTLQKQSVCSFLRNRASRSSARFSELLTQ